MLTFLAVLLILTPLTAFVTKQPRYFQSLSMTQASASSRSATSTVIFDIDGTLADSFELGFSATQNVLPADVSITHEDYHAHTIYPTPERLARHYYQMPIPNGEISDGPSLAMELGLVASKDEFIETGTRLGREFDELYIGLVNTETARFYDGISDMLLRLSTGVPPEEATTASNARPVNLGALTNAAVEYAEAVLQVNGVRSLFTCCHGADDVPRPKPHPDGLFVCVSNIFGSENILANAKSCVYVGDSPSDGRAAAAAGMKSIGVAYGSHSLHSISPCFDEIVHTPQELEASLWRLLLIEDPPAMTAFDGLSCSAFKLEQLQCGQQAKRIQNFLASNEGESPSSGNGP